jgi:hypothetical protein
MSRSRLTSFFLLAVAVYLMDIPSIRVFLPP